MDVPYENNFLLFAKMTIVGLLADHVHQKTDIFFLNEKLYKDKILPIL